MFKSELLEKTWAPVLDAADAPPFKDNYRRSITAVLLENQKKALAEESSQSSFLNEQTSIGDGKGTVRTWDPVLVSLVRRAMPNIVAYDIASVQPMTMPTGLIFAMRSKYQTGLGVPDREALFNKPETDFAGKVNTATGEALTGGAEFTGGETKSPHYQEGGGRKGFGQMGFTIERRSVTAETRALKAEYTMELAQDLKSVHGLDAEAELANILSTEVLAEINRELLDTINAKAVVGGAQNSGNYDIDNDGDGRWAVEKFKSLIFQIEIEANAIAKATRRGKGNFVICSSNVASALAAAGTLDYAPALSTALNVDDTGNVFAGVLNGRMKVFIDPFSTADYITVGYKGVNSYDAGMYYCPYVPLTMVRATDQDTFQPKIGFKTRYGLVTNPFAEKPSDDNNLGEDGGNPYFRRFEVVGLEFGTPTDDESES